MPFAFRTPLLSLLLLMGIAVGLLLAFVWSGLYNVGADDPHTRPVMALMETLRDRSIEAHSKDVTPPDLEDPQLVLNGAGHYAEMCTGCHLAPGMEESEIRPGLYPQPPDLSKARIDPKVAFWAIKHGIKMTAMPAWGGSHDDPTIWSMVAFLQKLPDLTPAQYRDLVAKAPPDEEMEGEHHHHGQAGGASGIAGDAHHHDAGGAHHDDGPAGDSADHAMATSAAIEGYAPKAVPEAERVAEAFHAALQEGNRQQVMALLAPDVTISEGGETQDRATYAAGHLGEDIAFLRTAKVHPLFIGSMPMGKTAMVATRSEVHATAKGKPLTLLSTEILTLEDTGKDWLVTRVEWSSERQP